MTQLRVLTVTDLRQDRRRYHALAGAVEEHRPDVVAVVGDFLEPRHREGQLSIIEATRLLAQLPVADVVFCRGDREGFNWFDFKFNWPHAMRPLIALYGRAHVVGPLALLGFPCHVGSESPWACTMPRKGNQVILPATHECSAVVAGAIAGIGLCRTHSLADARAAYEPPIGDTCTLQSGMAPSRAGIPALACRVWSRPRFTEATW
jgi:hypothetical protein